LAGAVTEIIIAGGPEPTTVPGQWCVVLNETPSADWRDRLLELVAADSVTAALRIELQGPALLFMSGNTTREVIPALRALYKLVRDANR
jgi:hypothetical protein